MKQHSHDTNLRKSTLLSIIIPALDVDRELRRCIDSIHVIFPDSKSFEIIVVVPAKQIDEAQKLLPDARVVPETNASIYGAMNDGMSASSGQYLYFLGKDDIVLPALFDAYAALNNDENISAMFCDVYWGNIGIQSGKPSKWKVIWKNYCHQGIIYSRQALEKHGPYPVKMRVQADHFINIKILRDPLLFKHVRYLDKPIAWYSGAGFSTSTRDTYFWRLYPRILRKFVGAWAFYGINIYRKLRFIRK